MRTVDLVGDVEVHHGRCDRISYQLVEGIPAVVWSGMAGAGLAGGLSLVNLIATQRHARKMQKAQLAHDANVRSRERHMALRREVYLEAAQAIPRMSGVLGRLADINISDQELSRVFEDGTAKLNQIQVIGSNDTIESVMLFLTEITAAYARLSVDRGLLTNNKKQIESLEERLQEFTEQQLKLELLRADLLAHASSDEATKRECAIRIEVVKKQADTANRHTQG